MVLLVRVLFPLFFVDNFLLDFQPPIIEMHVKILLKCFDWLLKLLLRGFSRALIRVLHFLRVKLFVAQNTHFVSDVAHDAFGGNKRLLGGK